jgi:hypothetical protein
MYGENFKLENDTEILRINSPKSSVGGPYAVVYKDITHRWVIVALDWEESPGLGIRWFWGDSGTPISTGYPIWFIIPSSLIEAILNGLPLAFNFRNDLEDFLSEGISGKELQIKYSSKE